MSDARRNGIIAIMAACTKVELVAYLRSHGLRVSGTKLQLAIRIYDTAGTVRIRIIMPPSGVVSIGIALDHDVEDLT